MPNQPQSPTPEAQPAMPTSDVALLPCPFCGLPATWRDSTSNSYEVEIGCINAQCWRPCTPSLRWEAAVSAWNTSAQSTPPEQRATRICYHCGPIENCDCAAHPEVVRMPIELPPLEVASIPQEPEAREQENRSISGRLCKSSWIIDKDDFDEYSQGMQDVINERERQLLAALTELQTERAAHERTRGELDKAEGRIGLLRVEIQELRSEMRDVAAERSWRDKQGDDYGSY